jgi:uncharacterized Zn finger protein (UPF0148 family)
MEPTILLIVLGGITVLATAVWLWHRLRRAEEPLLHRRCSMCGQKLRFRASRTGRLAGCPRCGHEEPLVEENSASRPARDLVGRRRQPPLASSSHR